MTNSAPAAAVRVSLLGGFSVTVDGQPVTDRWRLRKAKTLVKLLALHPGIGCTATSWWTNCGQIPSRIRRPTTCTKSCTIFDA